MGFKVSFAHYAAIDLVQGDDDNWLRQQKHYIFFPKTFFLVTVMIYCYDISIFVTAQLSS